MNNPPTASAVTEVSGTAYGLDVYQEVAGEEIDKEQQHVSGFLHTGVQWQISEFKAR